MKPAQATRPDIFDALWRHIPVAPEDILVDIGCGEGDAIQYWLDMCLDNFIIGIELDRAIYLRCVDRFRKQPQVLIVHGDATVAPPHGTLYYVFNPFGGDDMRKFEWFMRKRPAGTRIVYNATQEKELAMFKPPWWNVDNIVPKVEGTFRAALITRGIA